MYTSLIKIYINREELDTAWQIFDLIKYRSTETAPDVQTFTLMIHACALRGEAERALDLFRYMTETRGLEPDEPAYNALIHACAVRKDHFLEAWKFAIEMRNKGLLVGRWTLNHLLQACGKNGDITRARLLLRLMMSSESAELQPDERSFQNLLRAYAAAKLTPGPNQAFPQDALFLSPLPGGIQKLDKAKEARLPFLSDQVLTGKKRILVEAKSTLRYIVDFKPEFYSTRILNAYMDVCLTRHGRHEIRRVFTEYFAKVPYIDDTPIDSSYDAYSSDTEDASEDAEDELGEGSDEVLRSADKPKKNIFTFEVALEYARKAGNAKFAKQVWEERMRFCQTKSYWDMLQPIRYRLDFSAEKLMLQTLAKAGHLQEALERLEVLRYEYEWKPSDLKPLYDKAREAEDLEAVFALRKVLNLDDKRW